MENIIYNELVIRGYNVDVGVVEKWEKDENSKSILKNLEVDFICNLNDKKYYIQSVYSIDDEEKKNKELKSLNSINDSFKKLLS